MLVQLRRDGGLRLFRQHDHALLAGELAACWRGAGRDPAPLPFELVLATALHDLAWRRLDREPRLDEQTGRPMSFYDMPVQEKVEEYGRGLTRLEKIHPYAGLLGSLHYSSFPDVRDADPFQRAERRRRARLRAELGIGDAEENSLQRHRRWLAFFDRLSLFICLVPPSSDVELQPAWVEDARHLESPTGGAIHLTWVDDEVLHVDPFPFRATLELRLRHRELSGAPYADREALRTAWAAARDRWWTFTVQPSPRLA